MDSAKTRDFEAAHTHTVHAIWLRAIVERLPDMTGNTLLVLHPENAKHQPLRTAPARC